MHTDGIASINIHLKGPACFKSSNVVNMGTHSIKQMCTRRNSHFVPARDVTDGTVMQEGPDVDKKLEAALATFPL